MFKIILKKKNKTNLGITLIEVLVACSIISLSMFALMTTAQKGLNLSSNALMKSQASLLLEEGAEAVKSIRDNDNNGDNEYWTTISSLSLSPTQYHLFFNTTTKLWLLDGNTTSLSGYIPSYPIDGVFDRTVTIFSVNRDTNDDIVTGGGNLDAGTKKVVVTVTWTSGGVANTNSLSFYISNIFK